MNIIERLISGYPHGDVSPQDFIDHLSIGADGWVGAWVAVGLAVIFGMLVYIIPIYLTEKDKVGPYHCGCTRSTVLPTSWASGCFSMHGSNTTISRSSCCSPSARPSG